jgi:phosphoglycolate phosphatase-like HAD superfamily hydrolase
LTNNLIKKQNLLVFDIDGTLTDTVLPHQKAFVQALQQIGVQQIDTNFKSYKHHTDSFIAKEIFEKDTRQPFDSSTLLKFEQHLLNNLIQALTFTEIAGAKDLLAWLEKETNYAICFATGSLLQPAIYKMEQVGIPFIPSSLVASNQILERENIVKAAIQAAKKRYQVNNFERIISLGDGLWDLKTAQNLSLEFIGVGSKNKAILQKAGAKICLDDFKNCRDLFF